MGKFKIALAMAGAVSAGAYSAGVLDYLLETLELWERAKKKNKVLQDTHPETYSHHPDYDHSIPMHEVEIDLIAGSSAGGISGSLAFLSLSDGQYLNDEDFPRNERHYENQLFYRCWVDMDDDQSGTTLEKMLALDDIKTIKNLQFQHLPSLFNVTPIENIANRAFEAISTRLNSSFPPFVHPQLDLLLTVTNLDGLPFNISFNGDEVIHHTLVQHAAFMGYRRQNSADDPPRNEGDPNFYPLNLALRKHLDYLKEFTLSTAAFPIALKARNPSIPSGYLEQYRTFLFGPTTKPLTDKIIIPVEEKKYTFLASDGGIINNKPFGLATLVMKSKAPKHAEKDQYAVIMIDPLPKEEEVTAPQGNGILAVAKSLFNALRNQAFFHQLGLNEVLKMHNRTRFMVVPRRKYKTEDQPHLAAAALSGFAGFIDKRYREHDYLLGRKNCQDFLRYYFAVEVSNHQERLATAYTADAKLKYGFKDQGSHADMVPIIPDMRIEKTLLDASKLPYPSFPHLNTTQLDTLIDHHLMKRLKFIVNTIKLPFLLRVNVALLKPFLYLKIRKTLKTSYQRQIKD